MLVDLTTFHPTSGFCDRLRAITLGIAIAKQQGESQFSIKHQPTRGCPYELAELFEIEGMKLVASGDSPSAPALTFDCYSSFPSKENARAHGSGLPDTALFSQWKNAYRLLRPNPATRAQLEQIGIGGDCLGVHLRMTDKRKKKPGLIEIHKKDTGKVTRATLRAVRAQLAAHGLRKVFLACDDQETRSLWTDTLHKQGVDVVLNENCKFSTDSFRQTSGQDFATDLFGLAGCKLIVGSVNSGVPVTAALIKGQTLETILWGRYYKRFKRLDWNLSFVRARRSRRMNFVRRFRFWVFSKLHVTTTKRTDLSRYATWLKAVWRWNLRFRLKRFYKRAIRRLLKQGNSAMGAA